MEIILIRHGQSEHNARLSMVLDSNLTELGLRQAQTTAEYLLGKPIVNDPAKLIALASPFRRTLQTSRPLAEKANIIVHAYPYMCEYFSDTNDAYTDFIGMTPGRMQAEFPFVRTDSAFAVEPAWWPESREDVHAIYQRACNVRDQLYDRYFGTDSQVLIYSHAEPIGRLIEAMQHIGPAEGWPPWTENCGINRLLVHNPSKPAEIVVLNDISHLKANGTNSPT